MSWQILQGDCIERMQTLEPESVQTCVTSPPYFGLRDYGHDGQIGLEPTPDEFCNAADHHDLTDGLRVNCPSYAPTNQDKKGSPDA